MFNELIDLDVMFVIFVFVTFLLCFSFVFMLIDVFVIVNCGGVVALFGGGGWVVALFGGVGWFVIVKIIVDC